LAAGHHGTDDEQTTDEERCMSWSKRARAFWPCLTVALLADCTTKELADAYLAPDHIPHEVIGNTVRLTLAHNPYAGMGLLNVGSYSRVLIAAVVTCAIVLLVRLYRSTPGANRLRAAGLGLVLGGAIGNLASRIVSPSGVTDFFDVGVGGWRFYTFNVADVCVFCGALLVLRALGLEYPPATDHTAAGPPTAT
jgi:signal peptidase II